MADLGLVDTGLMLNLTVALYQPGINLVLSPFSLITALAMVLAGAGGTSQTELMRVLFNTNLSSDQDAKNTLNGYTAYLQSFLKENEFVLTGSNFLYGNQNFSIKPEYVQMLEKKFHASAKQLNFASEEAVKTINNDVSLATKGLINQLVDSVSSDQLVMLVNALYFKGLWQRPFKKEFTKQDGFTKSDGTVTQVPMMNAVHQYGLTHCPELKASAVRLDYTNSTISMLILLPDNSSSVEKLLRKLNKDTLEKLQQKTSVKWNTRKVSLTLPKFKLESTHELVPVLNRLGISEIFGSRANLSGISEVSLKVSRVMQKAVIEVNEEGTEAAAATGLKIVPYMAPLPPVYFKIDRPFVFLLTTANNKQNNIVFSGVVEQPIISA